MARAAGARHRILAILAVPGRTSLSRVMLVTCPGAGNTSQPEITESKRHGGNLNLPGTTVTPLYNDSNPGFRCWTYSGRWNHDSGADPGRSDPAIGDTF